MSVSQTPPPSLDAFQPPAPLPVLGHIASRWEPDAAGSVTDHFGNVLPPSRTYIAAPPEEIGAVLSALSNMDSAKGADGQMGKRILYAVIGLPLGAIVVWGVGGRIGLWDAGGASPIALAIGAIVGAIIGFMAGKPKYETSYVGTNGVASFEYDGNNKPLKNAKIFCFDNGATLKTQHVKQYNRGVYNGTNYSFTWHDAAGSLTHKMEGSFHHKEGKPKADSPYWFAIAAENAWSAKQLPLLRGKIAEGETVSFPVKGKGELGVSRDALSILFKGKEETIPLAELDRCEIRHGEVSIARRDAKKGFLGLGADGIYKFPAADMPDSRTFLRLLEEARTAKGETQQ